MGTLLISKGNIEWLTKGNSVNKKRLSLGRFALLIEEQGRFTWRCSATTS